MNTCPRWAVFGSSFRFPLIAMVVLFLLNPASTTGARQDNFQALSPQLFDLVLTRGDVATMVAIIAPDALIHTPEGEFRGQSGMKEYRAVLNSAFTSISFTTGEAAIEQDIVAVRWTMSGKHTGPYQGVAATCAFVAISGVAMLRLDGSRIAEQWMDYDRTAVVAQLTALAAVDTHSQDACAVAVAPSPEPTIPPCGPECDKPRGNR